MGGGAEGGPEPRAARGNKGDAQSRVSFPSPAPSPEGTISSGTKSARARVRASERASERAERSAYPAAIPIASLFDMRQFRPICRAP